MEHAKIELLLNREMPHARQERLPQRPIIGPFGKDFVHGRVMDGWFALGIFGTGKHFHCIPV